MRQYITTAIDYPNAAPHMGHVLEKVLADVCARWFRLRGDETRFQIGTDEHGVKIERTAKEEGISPKELVDRNVVWFEELYETLGISHDVFIRTSDQSVHWPTVTALWKELSKSGALEKRRYTGLYCSGCERFVLPKELEDGNCPNHLVPPEAVEEENWFFLLSQEGPFLKKLLTSLPLPGKTGGGYQIVPQFRAAETLSLIDQGLEDVSFSRPKGSLGWGVPVPDDPEQTMYVWCDALTNYISGLGYLTERAQKEWWDDAEVTHVIGKDIARFHALIWPAMLRHSGVRTPDRLVIHGFLTSEGQKMSKSLGNVVAPHDVIKKYGVDPLRFYLSHEIPVGRDGDFSWERFQALYDAKLRNEVGNLLQRVIVLLKKGDGKIGDRGEPTFITAQRKDYVDALNNFDCSQALKIALSLASDANKYIDAKRPWELQGEKQSAVLSGLAEALRHLSLALLPFVPETAQKISQQLGLPYAERMLEKEFRVEELSQWGNAQGWSAVGEPTILFPEVEV